MTNEHAARSEAVLILSDGTDYAIPAEGLVIGRQTAIGLMLNDLSVSRRHAEISYRDGAYLVADLNSSNGTTVNGEPVTTARRLEDADVLRLGDAAVTFRLRSAGATAAAAVPEPEELASAPVESAVIVAADVEPAAVTGPPVRRGGARLTVTAAAPVPGPSGSAVALRLSGVLDIETVEQLKGETQRLVEQDVVQFALDLAELTYLDSSGLGALAALHRAVAPRGGRVCLQHLQPPVRSIIQLTRLDKVFTVE